MTEEARSTADRGGETKLLLRGRRNLCHLEQWRSEMKERKMAAAPREEDE